MRGIMQFDREKLSELIVYVCSRCEPSQLGAVKLHKALYFSDMISYIKVGQPITGATYVKRPFGPTCDGLTVRLRELESSGAISIDTVDFFGFMKKQYTASREADLSRFSSEEISIIDKVIEFVCENSAKTISEFSHAAPWEMVEFGDEMPYHGALHLIPTQVSLEAMEWASAEAAQVVDTRARSKVVDFADFATFRGRVLQEG